MAVIRAPVLAGTVLAYALLMLAVRARSQGELIFQNNQDEQFQLLK